VKRRLTKFRIILASLIGVIVAGIVFVKVFAPRKVYLVPLGEISASYLDALVSYYRQKYNVPMEVLPAVKLEPWLMDYSRRQLVAEELVKEMKRRYPEIASDRTVILIGITLKDMFIRGYPWLFAFSWREGGRFAVVSAGRMDPGFFGKPPDEILLQLRMKKMITKNVGLMYFGHTQSTDPKSVLYQSILSIDDLDRVGENF
jgi:predicted Zn-dependent protease